MKTWLRSYLPFLEKESSEEASLEETSSNEETSSKGVSPEGSRAPEAARTGQSRSRTAGVKETSAANPDTANPDSDKSGPNKSALRTSAEKRVSVQPEGGEGPNGNQDPKNGSQDPDGNRGPIAGIEYTVRAKEEPDPDRPFAHGVVDGVEDAGRDPFERFLTQSSERQRLQEKLQELTRREETLRAAKEERLSLETEVEQERTRLKALKEKERRRRQKYESLKERVSKHAGPTGLDVHARADVGVDASSRESSSPEELASSDEPDPTAEPAPTVESVPTADLDSSAEPSAETRPLGDPAAKAAPDRGSLTYALLYSAAGLLFVAGDIIMSREVVSRALRLKGDAEPWIFAIGLAMLAVLMKPAYDRLVEKPYWNGKKRAFRWTIAVGVVAAALTLGVLGAFRADAFETRRKISRIQERLERGLKNGTLSKKQAAKLRKKRSSLQQSIAGSSLGFWSFVLSGVLFAAAGAVCLGIGLRHSRDWYHRSLRPLLRRWWRRLSHRRFLGRLRSRREKARSAYRAAQERRTEVEARLEAKTKRLEQTRSVERIREALERVRGQKKKVRAQLWVSVGHQGIEAYRNGYALANSAFEVKAPSTLASSSKRTSPPQEINSSQESAQPEGSRPERKGAGPVEAGNAASGTSTSLQDGSADTASQDTASQDATSQDATSQDALGDAHGDTSSEQSENNRPARRPFLAVRDAISRNTVE